MNLFVLILLAIAVWLAFRTVRRRPIAPRAAHAPSRTTQPRAVAPRAPAQTRSIPVPSQEPRLRRHPKPRVPERFVVLDLETTGLSPRTDEIIEIAAVRVDISEQTHPYLQTLVRPLRPLPKRITKLTGITQEMLDQGGCECGEAMRQLIAFIGDLPLVTFNAVFDMGFLHSEAARHGLAIENRYSCALQLARRTWPELDCHTLPFLAKKLQLPNTDEHRALGDCRRTIGVYMAALGYTTHLGPGPDATP